MTVKATVNAQYQRLVDKAAAPARGLSAPPQGWLRTVRTALGMTGAQLAKRLGVSRARVSYLEKAEIEGGVSLKTMEETARAMGCRFVYAVVPDETVATLIEGQARRKAMHIVSRASKHMALEDQTLSDDANRLEVERLVRNMLAHMPPDFWEDK